MVLPSGKIPPLKGRGSQGRKLRGNRRFPLQIIDYRIVGFPGK
jgi:hypothetical protein